MSPAAAVIGRLVRAIPAEDDASLVAQSGERARIASRAGSVDVGSAALTEAAIDALIAGVLPPGPMRALQESGVAQCDLDLPEHGRFTIVAASTPGERWLEIRRRGTHVSASAQPVAPAAPVQPIPPSTPVEPLAPPAPVPKAMAPTSPGQVIAEPDDSVSFEHVELPDASTDSDPDALTVPADILAPPAADASVEIENEPPTRISDVGDADDRAASKAGPYAVRRRVRLMTGGTVAAALLVAGVVAFTGVPALRRSTVTPSPAAVRHSPSPAPASVTPPQTQPPRSEPAPDIPKSTAPAATPMPAPAQANEPDDPARSGFSIQVAAVRTREEAARIATRFVAQGHPAYVVRGDGSAAGFYRVRVGTYPDRQAAEAVATAIELADGLKGWIAVEGTPDKNNPTSATPTERNPNSR